MPQHTYESEAFKSWCLCSGVTLAGVTILGLCADVSMGVMLLLLACSLHVLLIPAYLFRRKLGHPSWVMAPSLLPISIVFSVCAAYAVPAWFYTKSGFVLNTFVPLALWAPFLVYRPTKLKGALLVICLVVALFIPAHEAMNSRGRFLRDLYRVQPGMRIDEVETIMAGYIRGTGFPANPHSTGPEDVLGDLASSRRFATVDTPDGEMEIVGARVYRHSHDTAYNADWGIVEFNKGRVVLVTFSPD